MTKDVFCLSLSIKNKKVPKQDVKRERKGRELRIEGREYKEQSKSRKSKRKQREREQRECRDRWRVRTKRAEKIVSRIFLCFFT